ncbi:uncharacterized protein LOC143463119 [Clavelina lepadiformis]|uniref:uncharacterized protein LOC143463119 n=1 Tax=Clavelina lepadiformis TaxID=159417 RepID=UPI00404197FF
MQKATTVGIFVRNKTSYPFNSATVVNDMLNDTLEGARDNRVRVMENDERNFAIALLVLSSYFLLALLIYTWKKRNIRRDAPWVNNLCVLAAVMAFVSTFTKVLTYSFGLLTCEAAFRIGGAMHWINSSLTYTILWARQKNLHSNHLLAGGVSNRHRIFSTSLIFVIYILSAAVALGFQAVVHYKDRSRCVATLGDNINIIQALTVTSIVLTFLFQFLLFYLIVTPLLCSDDFKRCDILRWNLEKDIHRLVVRLAYCALGCVTSTILFNLVVLFNAIGIIKTLWNNVAALDLILNNLFMVLTFADWKARLFPFCFCDVQEQDP